VVGQKAVRIIGLNARQNRLERVRQQQKENHVCASNTQKKKTQLQKYDESGEPFGKKKNQKTKKKMVEAKKRRRRNENATRRQRE